MCIRDSSNPILSCRLSLCDFNEVSWNPPRTLNVALFYNPIHIHSSHFSYSAPYHPGALLTYTVFFKLNFNISFTYIISVLFPYFASNTLVVEIYYKTIFHSNTSSDLWGIFSITINLIPLSNSLPENQKVFWNLCGIYI